MANGTHLKAMLLDPFIIAGNIASRPAEREERREDGSANGSSMNRGNEYEGSTGSMYSRGRWSTIKSSSAAAASCLIHYLFLISFPLVLVYLAVAVDVGVL